MNLYKESQSSGGVRGKRGQRVKPQKRSTTLTSNLQIPPEEKVGGREGLRGFEALHSTGLRGHRDLKRKERGGELRKKHSLGERSVQRGNKTPSKGEAKL